MPKRRYSCNSAIRLRRSCSSILVVRKTYCNTDLKDRLTVKPVKQDLEILSCLRLGEDFISLYEIFLLLGFVFLPFLHLFHQWAETVSLLLR